MRDAACSDSLSPCSGTSFHLFLPVLCGSGKVARTGLSARGIHRASTCYAQNMYKIPPKLTKQSNNLSKHLFLWSDAEVSKRTNQQQTNARERKNDRKQIVSFNALAPPKTGSIRIFGIDVAKIILLLLCQTSERTRGHLIR